MTLTVLGYFFWLLLIIAFALEAWALFDALTVPVDAYAAASKQSKKLWMIILIVATVLGFANAVAPLFGASPLSLLLGILPVAAFIAAAVYLADVRPAVAPYKKRGGGRGGRGNQGPYGPW
ncbi:DUF2516 family protein [Actinomadura barringtoniae]|uniref:DUF2516 family protein n=1 Tax=Actinomadura barringtoniae TaxID=1427535 RepID=UPI0027DD57C4|nr:DUF2516 family protein [Actinomadura barringtoniae]